MELVYYVLDGDPICKSQIDKLKNRNDRDFIKKGLIRLPSLFNDTASPTGTSISRVRGDKGACWEWKDTRNGGPGFRVYFGDDRKNIWLMGLGTKKTQDDDTEKYPVIWKDITSSKGAANSIPFKESMAREFADNPNYAFEYITWLVDSGDTIKEDFIETASILELAANLKTGKGGLLESDSKLLLGYSEVCYQTANKWNLF